ncbi:hypothetical protein HK102_003511, partial [Quaeritorhiza haematococci]
MSSAAAASMKRAATATASITNTLSSVTINPAARIATPTTLLASLACSLSTRSQQPCKRSYSTEATSSSTGTGRRSPRSYLKTGDRNSSSRIESLPNTSVHRNLPRTVKRLTEVPVPESFTATTTVAGDPVIVFQNNRILGDAKGLLKAYQVCRERGVETLGRLRAEDFAAVLGAVVEVGGLDLEGVVADMQAAGVKATDEIHAAAVKVLGLAQNDVATAVRYVHDLAQKSKETPARSQSQASTSEGIQEGTDASLAESVATAPKEVASIIYDALLEVLSNAGCAEASATILENMIARGVTPSISAFNSVIGAFAAADEMDSAVKYFNYLTARHSQQQQQSSSSSQSWPAPNETTYAHLINGHALRGRVTYATKYFQLLKASGLKPTTKSWSALIKAHCILGHPGEAQNQYQMMRKNGVPASKELLTDLIVSHGKALELNASIRFFYKMESVEEFEPSVGMYAALITAYVNVGDVLSAWKVYRQMIETAKPSTLEAATALVPLASTHIGKHPHYLRDSLRFSYIQGPHEPVVNGLMLACLQSPTPNPEGALEIYNQYTQALRTDESAPVPTYLAETLVGAHALKGDIPAALKVKSELLSSSSSGHSLTVYNYLLSGYALKKDAKGALSIWEEMRANGVVPNNASYEA